MASLRFDAAAAFGYVTNWYLVLDQQSYWESWGRPSLFRHLWSLALEEQFYIVWPLLLTGGLALLKRRLTMFGCLLLAGASAAWMAYLYAAGVDPSRLYYGTDTRASGLLLGAALAFVWQPGRLDARVSWRQRTCLEGAAVAGLAAIAVACLLLREDARLLYQGGFALVALASCAAIVGVIHPVTWSGRLLGFQPLRWLGLRSYSIYLWHWPVFMLTRPGFDVSMDGAPLVAFRVALTLLLAEVSYRLVETPVRNGALGHAWRSFREGRGLKRWAFALPATAVTSAGFVALTLALASAHQPVSASLSPQAGGDNLEEAPVAFASTSPAALAPGQSLAGHVFAPDFARASLASALEGWDVPAEAGPLGGEEQQQQQPLPPPAKPVGFRVTAFGDSVMLGALAHLNRLIPGIEVDADIGRQLAQAVEAVQARKADGTLAPSVVIHLGNNGTFSERHFALIMEALADVPRVVVLNVRVPRPWEETNNAMLEREVRRYPNAILVDWHAVTDGHPDLLRDDRVHLTAEGAKVYADLVAGALKP